MGKCSFSELASEKRSGQKKLKKGRQPFTWDRFEKKKEEREAYPSLCSIWRERGEKKK